MEILSDAPDANTHDAIGSVNGLPSLNVDDATLSCCRGYLSRRPGAPAKRVRSINDCPMRQHRHGARIVHRDAGTLM